MKKIVILSLILIFIATIMIPIYSNAIQTGINPDSYRNNNSSSPKAQSMIEKVLGIVRLVGTILSVVILMIIGIRYMLGSVEERAEYKNTFKLYILGALLLFTGSMVPQIIYDIMKETV